MRHLLIYILTFLLGTAAAAQTSYKTITPVQADTLIKNHQASNDLVVIDVRGVSYYNNERIENSINLESNLAGLNDTLDKLDKNKVYLVYCYSGGTSPGFCTKLINKNIKTVYNLQGGFNAWKAAGLPTVKGSGTGIDNRSNALIVKIYPNPVTDLSTLEIDGFVEGEVRLEILNALGSVVLSRKMVPGRAITLNGRELSPGLDFYRLVLPQNQVKSGRFQVVR